MGKSPKYYGVARGHTIGVFRKLGKFQRSIDGYPGAQWKAFKTPEEAKRYIEANKITNPASAIESTPLKSKKSKLSQKSAKQNQFSEPPFHDFLGDVETPELPSLADPELIDSVFFQNFSSCESKILPQYGDALLKAMTIDILSELYNHQRITVVRSIMPFAISNKFYEQIYLHYGLDDFIPYNISCGSHRRGDILEAYIAAIEKDISRNGHGYQEARDWLFKVIALRLRRVILRDDLITPVHSTETSQKSLCPDTNYDSFGRSQSIFISEPDIEVVQPEIDIWRQSAQSPSIWRTCESKISKIIGWPEETNCSGINATLRRFRRFTLESLRKVIHQFRGKYPASAIPPFWSYLKELFNSLVDQGIITSDAEKMLFHYYRSYIYIRLNDIRSAIDDLHAVLSFDSDIFSSKVRGCSLKRLLSIQDDILCRSGVHTAVFGCGNIVQGYSVEKDDEAEVHIKDSERKEIIDF